MSKKRLKNKIFEWDSKHQIDFYWRRKNGVMFGSPEHKSMDFISMLFSLMEDQEFEKSKKQSNKDDSDDDFFDNGIIKMTNKEVDKEFDNIDLDEF